MGPHAPLDVVLLELEHEIAAAQAGALPWVAVRVEHAQKLVALARYTVKRRHRYRQRRSERKRAEAGSTPTGVR